MGQDQKCLDVLVVLSQIYLFKSFFGRGTLWVVTARSVEENVAGAELFVYNLARLLHTLGVKHVAAHAIAVPPSAVISSTTF